MRPTQKDAAVIYVDGDGNTHNGVIDEVFTQGAARIKLDKGGSVQATYSEHRKHGSFHYPSPSEAENTAAPKGKTQPAAPASAPASK